MSIRKNDSTTELNPGSGGSKMDESIVTQSDGITTAKRTRVVLGSDSGELYGDENPLPVSNNFARAQYERAQLLSISKLDVSITTRHRERLRRGDRLDLIDNRGPGGR